MEYQEIKRLMEDMGKSKLTEIDIEFPDGLKITMKKDNGSKIVEKNRNLDINNSSKGKNKIDNDIQENTNNDKQINDEISANIIKSPMVGTIYLKTFDKDSLFVKEGMEVKKGDILCIIEAMKLMNEITAEFDGIITKILVKDKEVVDFGKPLFVIKPI